jgi:hypothetical protein
MFILGKAQVLLLSAMLSSVGGLPENFLASTIDGHNIVKIFFYVGTSVISIHVKLQVILSSSLFYTAVRSRSVVSIP